MSVENRVSLDQERAGEGTSNEPIKENIYDAFARYLRLEVANGNATEDTVNAYYREVAAWTRWCKDRQLQPENAQPYHIEAFREEMKRRGLSIVTCAYKLSIIRQFYESAVQAEICEENPAAKVWVGKDPVEPEERLKILSESALTALIDSLPTEGISGLRDRTLIILMAIHGLRRVEVHRLNHENIKGDLSLSQPGFLLVDGRAHKVRRIDLRPDVWLTLSSYIRTKVHQGYQQEGAIFVGHGNNGRGGRLSRVSINAIVDKYLSTSSLKKAGVSSHALRHTFGTLAVAGGAKLGSVRDALGHASIETTSIYSKAAKKGEDNPSFFINVDVQPK